MLALAAVLTAATVHPVALSVSPARSVLRAPSSRTLQLSNLGAQPVTVELAWIPIGARWLSVTPRHLLLGSGAHAIVTVRAGATASPGDHEAVVFATGRPTTRGRVALRLRVGVHVRVRAPGRLVHRLALEGLRARRLKRTRTLLVAVANRGNVTEQLRGRLRVILMSHEGVISRLRLGRFHELYPGAEGVVALRYRGGTRGLVTAVVTLRLGAHRRPLERRFRLTL